MAQSSKPSPSPAPAFPALDARSWSIIVEALRLSPQQGKIVALILQGKCDKEIGASLGLSVPTIRTQLTRIFQRNQLEDRIALILRAFALVNAAWLSAARR